MKDFGQFTPRRLSRMSKAVKVRVVSSCASIVMTPVIESLKYYCCHENINIKHLGIFLTQEMFYFAFKPC